MAEMSTERELLRMFDALFEGRLEPEDERRLAERLRDDPAACLQYVRYADIHATLTDTRRFGEVASQSSAPIEHDDGDTRCPAGSEVGPKHESTALLKQIIATSVGALSHSSADDDVVARLGDFRKVERRGGLRSYVVGLSLVLAGILIGGVTMWRVAAEHF